MRLAERLFRQGQQSADPLRGALHLQAALALWRGRPLADLAGLPWLEEQAERLDLFCVQVKRAWFGARLAAGEHGALVPELEQMVADRPLDEHVQAQLMLALYRSGRQADALDAFQRLRRTLAEELGIDPGRELRDLETAILRQDPALDAPATAAGLAQAMPRVPIPAQLPTAVPVFARGAGVPGGVWHAPARIPAALPAEAGLFRSPLAGKRVLVVLDNARDGEQVRALLPGSPGCLALVTSRNRLTGLVATEGAYPLALDPGGDLTTDARAVFSWSYRALSDPAAWMSRLLGLHPGPDISLAAAASLARGPAGSGPCPLDELTQAHLLAEHTPGRYMSVSVFQGR